MAFVRRERVPATGEVDGHWPGAPDLVVEVISPNDLCTEVDEKVAERLAYGAHMAIMVNPRRSTVAVYRPNRMVRILNDDDILNGEDIVPGWTLPVHHIFAHGLVS